FFPQGGVLKVKYISLPEKVSDLKESFESQNLQIAAYPDLRQCLVDGEEYRVTEENVLEDHKYLKSVLRFFKAQSAALIPILQKEQAPVGVVLLMKYEDEIDIAALTILKELLALASERFAAILGEEVVVLEEVTAKERYEKLLSLKSQIVSWEKGEGLAGRLFHELFPILHFELGWVQVARERKLPIVAGAGSNPETERIYGKLLSFFGDMEGAPSYTSPPGPEMACCFPFINNSFAYIPDVFAFYKNLKNIKLPPKDEKAMIMVGKPFRTVLQLPIRREGKSRGLVQLVSFSRKAPVNEKDIALLIDICEQIPLELYF
ncbi:MAG: hypothetical protein CVV50_05995, partial [Spirochaetae bacterium HGW-Spirochaetae-6]